MTEREQALAYMQALKNEGDSDHEAIYKVSEMYGLTLNSARTLLEECQPIPFSGRLKLAFRNIIVIWLLCFLVLLAMLYNYYVTKHSYDETKWLKVNGLILRADCIEENAGDEAPGIYYALPFNNTSRLYAWKKSDHLYCFNTAAPDRFLHAGDTLSIWIDRDINDYSIVYDVEKNGKRLLNTSKRDSLAAKEINKEIRILLIIGAILSMIVPFIKEGKELDPEQYGYNDWNGKID